MYLIVKSEDQKGDLGEHLRGVFRPFTRGVWICLIVAILCVSTIFTLQEAGLSGSQPESSQPRPKDSLKPGPGLELGEGT